MFWIRAPKQGDTTPSRSGQRGQPGADGVNLHRHTQGSDIIRSTLALRSFGAAPAIVPIILAYPRVRSPRRSPQVTSSPLTIPFPRQFLFPFPGSRHVKAGATPGLLNASATTAHEPTRRWASPCGTQRSAGGGQGVSV